MKDIKYKEGEKFSGLLYIPANGYQTVISRQVSKLEYFIYGAGHDTQRTIYHGLG